MLFCLCWLLPWFISYIPFCTCQGAEGVTNGLDVLLLSSCLFFPCVMMLYTTEWSDDYSAFRRLSSWFELSLEHLDIIPPKTSQSPLSPFLHPAHLRQPSTHTEYRHPSTTSPSDHPSDRRAGIETEAVLGCGLDIILGFCRDRPVSMLTSRRQISLTESKI